MGRGDFRVMGKLSRAGSGELFFLFLGMRI